MALSKAVSDDDRTRFFRLISVIIEDLTTILQDLLRREIGPSQLFNRVKQKSKHLRPDQIVLISNAKTQGYKEFDITLLYTLLRNFCPNIQPPTQSWGMSNMPAQGETTEGDDIERIRLIRNKLLGHISVPTITDIKFQTEWRIISEICTRMQAMLPNTQYVQKLEEAKDRTIDSDMEKGYMEKIKELVEDETTVKKLLMKVLEDRALTSSENITIEAKTDEKRQFVETLSDMCISILNEMIDTIHGLTSESEIEQLYESVEDFIRETKDIENSHLENLLKRLEDKIKTYAKLQYRKKMKILARFLKFSLGMKKNYDACVESSKGSLLLTVTFSSTKCYDLYKKDLENGVIGQQILQLISYPPFLASFHLQVDDLVVCMNGQKLTHKSGDESIFNKSSDLETCADHSEQFYTMACQQCQLPVCDQCMDLLKHKGHSFLGIFDFLSEKKTKLYESLKLCYLTKIRLLSRKKQLETEVDKMQFIMNSKYRALQYLLDEYLLQNTKTIEAFLESQTDEIDSKVMDIDRYMSDVNKQMDEISKNRPAQAMIQLQSCSLREDLFQIQRIVYPDIKTKDTDLMDAINLFGNIPKSMGAKASGML